MKRVLVTGAGGGVTQMALPMLRESYKLRLTDVRPIKTDPVDEFVLADLRDVEAMRKAVRGVDAIIHLGAISLETDWQAILGANIEGTYNVFEAARLEGVKRIIFASSNHAMGFYPRDAVIPVDVTVRPDSRYGLSKAFGEAVGSLFAHKYGAEVFTIRIGHILPKPESNRDLAIWLSPRDLVQLLKIGIEAPGIRHTIVYGASDNKRSWWINTEAERLGYRPQDRSEDFAEEILARDNGITGDPQNDDHQGGIFCVAEELKPDPRFMV
jgi:uronate dehydrogenase